MAGGCVNGLIWAGGELWPFTICEGVGSLTGLKTTDSLTRVDRLAWIA
jgi:hypothetical protein